MEDKMERERIEILVQQGFTPSLARNVLLARSREYLPLTIWIVDNSGSMAATDGQKIVSTKSQDNIRLEQCSRWEELKETVLYHAQLATLLDAPTRFLMLNGDDDVYPQEMSIAERGSEWVEDDMEHFRDHFSSVRPQGVTPLTSHLLRIFQSLKHTEAKIVLVLATDGKPTDEYGFISPSVDRAFEDALRHLQSKAWIVVRLCTDDASILEYYQKLDEQLELSLEVLDDYVDEAKEVNQHNPWLTYSLGLHRCREMGMSCHPTFRFLDWLDERPLARNEIRDVLYGTLGLIDVDDESIVRMSSQSNEDWDSFCAVVKREQETINLQPNTKDSSELKAFFPWNPMRKRTTHWVDITKLRRHGYSPDSKWPIVLKIVIPFVAYLVFLNSYRNR